MVTFESKVTKSGNLKVSSQLREILGLFSGQRVTAVTNTHLTMPKNSLVKISVVAV